MALADYSGTVKKAITFCFSSKKSYWEIQLPAIQIFYTINFSLFLRHVI